VTETSKSTFAAQRKEVGDTTRTDMKNWKNSRMEAKDQYATKAVAAKAEADLTKQAAKEAKETMLAARAKAAKEMRDKRNNIEINFGKVKGDLKQTKQQVHDMTKTRKYVGPDAAETMRQKKAVVTGE